MRFLCLHGAGTSGEILSMQLAGLKQKLSNKGHRFDFWDGPHESSIAGPGVGPFFEGPYYRWYQDTTEPEIRQAAEDVLSKIRSQREPYDAVIGFSQGVCVIGAMILLCKNEGQTLPFKGAMLFCGGIPLPFLANYMQVSQKALETLGQTAKDLGNVSAKNAKKFEVIMQTGRRLEMWDYPTLLWDGKQELTRDPWTLPPLDETDVFDLDMSSLPTGATVDIPTVVVYGHKDPMCSFHVQLAMLCNPENRLVYDHRGGHEIPRKPNVMEDLVTAMSWLEQKLNASS